MVSIIFLSLVKYKIKLNSGESHIKYGIFIWEYSIYYLSIDNRVFTQSQYFLVIN